MLYLKKRNRFKINALSYKGKEKKFLDVYLWYTADLDSAHLNTPADLYAIHLHNLALGLRYLGK